jgi:hypothetical protein
MVPANGLIYALPKRCICWPMLRDYVALAPALPGDTAEQSAAKPSAPEPGPAHPPEGIAPEDPKDEWPCYRHDAIRSGGTAGRVPPDLQVLWTAILGDWPRGPIADDWRENYFIRGPVGPPVAARGLVIVARPDAHEVVALDALTGKPRWTFIANGRVDTAPTIHRGLCLFGCKSGWVYCLRADDGRLVWRLRVAPRDQRIVAYGQLESPWPVPGSVLVIDDTVYFAAGRHPSADGGILVCALEPATGRIRWQKCLDRVPHKDFYESSAMDFENFDLLHREGDAVAMSRWLFDRATGKMTCDAKSGFARLVTGGSGVLVPRGSWSYAPPHEPETWPERPFLRPLVAFRDNSLYICSQDRRTVFRRDFHLDKGEKFNTDWYGGAGPDTWNAKYGMLWRAQRLSHDAAWSAVPFPLSEGRQTISAVVLTGDVLWVASSRGGLRGLDTKHGRLLTRLAVPPAAWDGMAAAGGRLFLSTQNGRVVCLGSEPKALGPDSSIGQAVKSRRTSAAVGKSLRLQLYGRAAGGYGRRWYMIQITRGELAKATGSPCSISSRPGTIVLPPAAMVFALDKGSVVTADRRRGRSA